MVSNDGTCRLHHGSQGGGRRVILIRVTFRSAKVVCHDPLRWCKASLRSTTIWLALAQYFGALGRVSRLPGMCHPAPTVPLFPLTTYNLYISVPPQNLVSCLSPSRTTETPPVIAGGVCWTAHEQIFRFSIFKNKIPHRQESSFVPPIIACTTK